MASSPRIALLLVGLVATSLVAGLAGGCGDKTGTGGPTPGTGNADPTQNSANADVAPRIPDNARDFDVFAKFCVDSLNWAAPRAAKEKWELTNPADMPKFTLESAAPVEKVEGKAPESEHRRIVLRYNVPPGRHGDMKYSCRVTLVFRLDDASWVRTDTKMDEFEAPTKDRGETQAFNLVVDQHSRLIRSLFDRTMISTAPLVGG